MQGLWLGVGIGVAAVALAILLVRLVTVAWTRIMRESRVDGTYLVFDDPGHSVNVGKATIKQRGTTVYVRVDRNISRDGEYYEPPTAFFCEGYFRAGVLTALFFDADASYRPGAIALHYDPARACFVGKAVYYRPETGMTVFHMELLREVRLRSDL